MKKNSKLFTVLMAAALAVLVVFTACSKQSSTMTLEDYAKDHPEIQEEVAKAFDGTGLDGDVKIEGNKIIMKVDITSMLADTMGEAAAAALDDSMKDVLKASFDAAFEEAGKELQSALADVEKETKISGISMDVVIVFNDETVWEKNFTAA